MSFKDLLRLLRRRWPVALVTAALVFVGFLAWSFHKERPVYRARARIQITTPQYLLPATQNAQWSALTPTDPRTWLSIIPSRPIRTAAREILAQRKDLPPGTAEAVDTVIATPEAAGELVWVETLGPAPESAALAANAVARAVQADSLKRARGEIEDAIRNTRNRRAEQEGLQRREEQAGRAVREAARTAHGAESLEFDVKKLQDDLASYETRRRDLERRASTNRFRLERVRADRSVTEHLQRETVPRLGTASIEARVADNARVKAVTERLEGLHKELLVMLRKYTDEHPQVKGVRGEIRETEVELTRTQIRAVGFDIDREELALRADNELVTIELRVLDPELKDIKTRLQALSPALDRAKQHDRAAAEIGTRLQTLDRLLDEMAAAAPNQGYIGIQQDAEPDEALRVEGKLLKSWFLALVASLVFGGAVAFLLDFMDTSIRNDYDVRRHLDFPVLAVIPRIGSDEIRLPWQPGPVSEIFDTLGTVLLSLPADRASRVLLVTSTNPEEGKTAVSTHLASALARQGKRTLLIDADMRLPSVHAILGLENATGLSDLLSGRSPAGTPGLLQEIEGTNLKVLPSGVPPENPYELLDPGRVVALLAPFRDQFDVIVVDTPPVLRAGDALKLSSAADAVLFVVQAGKTDVRQATWAKRLLASVSARVAGVVLNRTDEEGEEYYYYRGTREARGGESRRESRRL